MVQNLQRMKKSSILIIIYLFLLLFSFQAKAQVSIDIPDTVVFRGEDQTIILPVEVSGLPQQFETIVAEFKYDSRILNLTPEPDANAIMAEPELQPGNFTPLDSALITVSDNNANSSGSFLMNFRVEGLISSDSIAYILPHSLTVDGEQLEIVENSAEVIVRGDPIFKTPTEGLGQNYPNPFMEYTLMEFTVKEPTRISFSMYSSFGEKARISDEEGKDVEIRIYQDGTRIENYRDQIFQEGSYDLQIIPSQARFSSGIYFVVMETNNSVYNKAIIYKK